ncbi:hypothetical protein [Bacillus cereus]|uniref:hypothetical protein n=1 Tax=Bacillus cereus group TaxID=86661 RepID=UPI000995CD70|nr:hypothetical protein [Bacillus cereus]OPA26140.1 hypothetical protein BHL53_06880 [Bacillus cereus]
MHCTKKTFELPVPIPQIRIDFCNDVLCIKTRNYIYKINLTVCYPNLPQVANLVLGKAIEYGVKITAMKIMTAPEPTAQIAIDAFTEGFNSYLNNQKQEIKSQFTDVTTNITVNTDYSPWKNADLIP